MVGGKSRLNGENNWGKFYVLPVAVTEPSGDKNLRAYRM